MDCELLEGQDRVDFIHIYPQKVFSKMCLFNQGINRMFLTIWIKMNH